MIQTEIKNEDQPFHSNALAVPPAKLFQEIRRHPTAGVAKLLISTAAGAL
jgi:hypothetical protein